MALTVIVALAAAFVLSLTFVPALLAIWLSQAGRGERGADRALARCAIRTGPRPRDGPAPQDDVRGDCSRCCSGAATYVTLGQEFLPQLDEGDLTAQLLRVPGTSVDQSQAMQLRAERALAALPEVKFVFSKTGTAELASDPMPPNISDTFIIMKNRKDWPDPRLSKAELTAKVEKALANLPGNAFEISQPIQMRFNELIAGVRGDVAVKVFGDDSDAMAATANRIAAVLRKTEGATDVRVEQTEGLPMLDIRPNRDAMATLGITAAALQETVAAAVGGRDAGVIFEGDRRFAVTIRLSDAARADFAALGQVPVPTPGAASFRSKASPSLPSSTARTRSAARMARGGSSFRPMSAAAMSRASSKMRRAPSANRCACPRGNMSNGAGSSKISPRRETGSRSSSPPVSR